MVYSSVRKGGYPIVKVKNVYKYNNSQGQANNDANNDHVKKTNATS